MTTATAPPLPRPRHRSRAERAAARDLAAAGIPVRGRGRPRKDDATVTIRELLPYRYAMRAYQRPFWKAMLGDQKKRAALVWHRRSGKDTTALNFMITMAVQRVGLYLYLFPTYALAKKSLWEGRNADGMRFMEHIPEVLIAASHETELKKTLVNGSIIQFVGTDNYNFLRGTNPLGCVFSEYSYQDPGAYNMVSPILKENGGWAVFAYTPNGRNHGYHLYERAKSNPEWFAETLTVRETMRPDGTPVITEADIEAERLEGKDEEWIQQEYFVSFTGAVQGSYFARDLQRAYQEGRVGRVPADATRPVQTAWDLGMDDEAAIWFLQPLGREIRVLDYVSGRNRTLGDWATDVLSRPFGYDEHLLPHDAKVREYSSGRARIEILESLKIRPTRVLDKTNVADQIQALRALLPRLYFNEATCEPGLAALMAYSREWDEELKTFKPKPRHDWSSHGTSALMTYALGYRDPVSAPMQTQAETGFDPFEPVSARHATANVATMDFDPFGRR